MMNFLVVSLSEMYLVCLSCGGDKCEGYDFETDEVCYSVREVCI